jgi:UDP-N-acetylglucosamine--N-acetylmuramyl-(pentapeptide) pyrophosphoryl-undecaprenol N-acetylglucosamine transferase
LARKWSARAGVTLYHVSGRRDYEALRQDLEPPAEDGAGLCYRVVAYQEDMASLYAACDLCVCRSGAMTVAELAAVGIGAVLVPLPGAPGDHQSANARALVAAGAAVLLVDAECDAAHLEAILDPLVQDPQRRAAMGVASSSLFWPDAADRVAEVVEANAR